MTNSELLCTYIVINEALCFSFSFSHLHFLINKVYVYISFYSTHILTVFAFSTSQQPMPRKLVRHGVFAHIYICILSLSLSLPACIRRDVEFTPRFVWPSLLPPYHPFALHPAACIRGYLFHCFSRIV